MKYGLDASKEFSDFLRERCVCADIIYVVVRLFWFGDKFSWTTKINFSCIYNQMS